MSLRMYIYVIYVFSINEHVYNFKIWKIASKSSHSIYLKKRHIKCTKNKLRYTNASFTWNNDYGHTS